MGNATSKAQSSSTSSSSTSTSSSVVICYYELLQVEQTATADEIKRAYRTKALQLHPDKNMHRVQEATELFAKIQNAYQVLSDAQERAFYDRHRESILRKGKQKHQATEGYTVDDLMAYFDVSAFKGYGDDPKGFYAVYRNIFAFLEDLEAEETDPPHEFASFGSKNTPFEPSLKAFYDKFLHFSSQRAFYEADNYDDSYAENRRHRRAIDKENQKFRDGMRREYNDTVRNLAAWTRKRDPRWHEFQKQRSIEKETAEARRKSEIHRKRQEQAESYVAPQWAVDHQLDEDFLLRQLERLQFEADHADDSESPEEKDDECEELEEEFYCVVCKKLFRNHQQWKNHERSKKHRASLIKAGFDPEAEDEASAEEGEADDTIDEVSETNEDVALKDSYIADSDPAPHVTQNSNEIGQKPPKKKIRQKQKPSSATAFSEPSVSKTKSDSAAKRKTKKPDDSDFKCKVCGEVFESRNKLFRHVEVEGHASFKTNKK